MSTADKLRIIMNKKHNIRNMSVIGAMDHGKSTITDSLVAAGGIIAQEVAGGALWTDTRDGEAELGIKSAGISLYYEMSDASLAAYKGERDGNAYLINLIDLPGQVDFSSEVTASLRITDGALVVVDCTEGVCVQTETVLRQALGEWIRPVLTVNKMDRCFLELRVDGEEAYQTLKRVIENANALLGDLQVSPEEGTVAFSAGLHGWAFTLTYFAALYASMYGADESTMLERLWGENFFDTAEKKWTTKHTGSGTCKRGFVLFCYQPIKDIMDLCMDNQKDRLWCRLEKLKVTMKSDEKDLVGEALMKRVMQTWLPASTALLEMMIYHLPSPSEAQSYRVSNLYDGPLDDAYATAIRNCDPEGPLMLYVSKMIPASGRGRFFAFGRVFSGRVSKGLKVRIMGPNYVPGEKKDLYVTSVQSTVIWMGKRLETVEDVPCGNTVALLGLNPFITKTATLTNEKELAHPLKPLDEERLKPLEEDSEPDLEKERKLKEAAASMLGEIGTEMAKMESDYNNRFYALPVTTVLLILGTNYTGARMVTDLGWDFRWSCAFGLFLVACVTSISYLGKNYKERFQVLKELVGKMNELEVRLVEVQNILARDADEIDILHLSRFDSIHANLCKLRDLCASSHEIKYEIRMVVCLAASSFVLSLLAFLAARWRR